MRGCAWFFYACPYAQGMGDELRECAAAFFRSIGKDVTTPEGFVMGASLELKWMPPSDAKRLLALLKSAGILEERDGYIRPSSDLSGIDVPMAYRPPHGILDAKPAAPAPKADAPRDMFHILMDVAVSNGIDRKDYIQGCNRITRELNIDAAASALIVLRDRGIDISPYADDVYDYLVALSL